MLLFPVAGWCLQVGQVKVRSLPLMETDLFDLLRSPLLRGGLKWHPLSGLQGDYSLVQLVLRDVIAHGLCGKRYGDACGRLWRHVAFETTAVRVRMVVWAGAVVDMPVDTST